MTNLQLVVRGCRDFSVHRLLLELTRHANYYRSKVENFDIVDVPGRGVTHVWRANSAGVIRCSTEWEDTYHSRDAKLRFLLLRPLVTRTNANSGTPAGNAY